ncbi:MAG: hypothetical protein KZQ65_07915 [Candidatus Thiodiazotropha sp. (ex Gloverina cf. vestifex)]|nr:hypothetical protein [Candidatus Thiodiazotropha sp. (ex Gloverina cf. vestifex)]
MRYHLAAAHARAGNSARAKRELTEIFASNKTFSEQQSCQSVAG